MAVHVVPQDNGNVTITVTSNVGLLPIGICLSATEAREVFSKLLAVLPLASDSDPQPVRRVSMGALDCPDPNDVSQGALLIQSHGGSFVMDMANGTITVRAAETPAPSPCFDRLQIDEWLCDTTDGDEISRVLVENGYSAETAAQFTIEVDREEDYASVIVRRKRPETDEERHDRITREMDRYNATRKQGNGS